MYNRPNSASNRAAAFGKFRSVKKSKRIASNWIWLPAYWQKIVIGTRISAQISLIALNLAQIVADTLACATKLVPSALQELLAVATEIH